MIIFSSHLGFLLVCFIPFFTPCQEWTQQNSAKLHRLHLVTSVGSLHIFLQLLHLCPSLCFSQLVWKSALQLSTQFEWGCMPSIVMPGVKALGVTGSGMPSRCISRCSAHPHTWPSVKYSTDSTWKHLELSYLSQKRLQLSRTTKTKRYWHYNWQIWFTIQNLAPWGGGLLTYFLPKTIFLSIVMALKGRLIHSWQQRQSGLMVTTGRPPLRRFSIFVRFVLAHCFLALLHFSEARRILLYRICKYKWGR